MDSSIISLICTTVKYRTTVLVCCYGCVTGGHLLIKWCRRLVIVFTCGKSLLNCDYSCSGGWYSSFPIISRVVDYHWTVIPRAVVCGIRPLPCPSLVYCSSHLEDCVCALSFGSCAIINCLGSVVLDEFGSIVHFGLTLLRIRNFQWNTAVK